ncbi:hypothetical protein [Algoriphagus terrigena]|uniref:hypothetical protein n=1 Tax=Algoriphagus terrigena TaxID=344884 RepID=UPI00047DED81|nr:hypothetical protein [Algoriphagus terrigena]
MLGNRVAHSKKQLHSTQKYSLEKAVDANTSTWFDTLTNRAQHRCKEWEVGRDFLVVGLQILWSDVDVSHFEEPGKVVSGK